MFRSQIAPMRQDLGQDIPPIMNMYKWKFAILRLFQTYCYSAMGFIYILVFFLFISGRQVIYTWVTQTWWIHLIYIVASAFILTLTVVFPCFLFRYMAHVSRRLLRKKRKWKRIVPGRNLSVDPLQQKIDAQMKELLGDADDSEEDSEDGMNTRSVSKKLTRLIKFDRLALLIGEHYSLRRDLILRGIFSFILFSGMIFTLTPYRLCEGFVNNYIIAWIYSVIMTIIFSFCIMTLIANDVPELNQHQNFEYWNPFYRSFYMLLLFLVDAISALSAPISTTKTETLQLINWNRVTHIGALFIPFGIWIGLLPQANEFLSWAFEFMQVYFHGGSPASSNERLFIMTMYSWLATVAVFFAYNYGSGSLGVLLAFGIGFFLANGTLIDYTSSALHKLYIIIRKLGRRKIAQPTDYKDKNLILKWNIQNVILFTISMGVLILSVTSGVLLYITDTSLPLSYGKNFAPSSLRDVWLYISYGFEAILLLVLLGSKINTFFNSKYFFNIIQNPLFGLLSTKPMKYYRVLYHISACILLSLYLILFADRVLIIPHGHNGIQNWFTVFAESMLLVRCFRWTWQNTNYAYAEVIVVAVLEKIPFGNSWSSFSFVAKLFFFGFGVHRLHTVMDRLKFILQMHMAPLLKKRLRFRNWPLVYILNIVFFPILVIVFLASVILGVPLLPLFGLPIFFVASLRPLRTWTPTGESYTNCEDTAFYKDMETALLQNISNQLAGGALMDKIHPGDIILFRSETFIAWVELLERGFGYARLVVKGLELQTTSCHAEEATHLDGLVDQLLSNQGSTINRYFLNTFQPLYSTHIDSYSISNISLVGIMDQTDTFDDFFATLGQCMVWEVKKKLESNQITSEVCENLDVFPFDSFELSEIEASFPRRWYLFLMNEVNGRSLTPPSMQHSARQLKVNVPGETHVTTIEEIETKSFILSSSSSSSSSSDDDNEEADKLAIQVNNIPIPPLPNIRQKSNDNVLHGFQVLTWTQKLILSTILALRKSNLGNELNAFKIYEIFSGERFAFDNFIRENDLIRDIFMKAFCNAVYLRLESKMYGLDIENDDFPSLRDNLRIVSETFSISCNSKQYLQYHSQVTTYFTLEKSSIENTSYKATYWKRSPIQFYVGKLNAEAVRSLWANLQQELYYFTNDDDERLSIQAMSLLLRNMTIQSAEPPLGYPIYNSCSSISTI